MANAKELNQWQKSRWKTGVDQAGSTPVSGYGPNGEYTLWIPRAEIKRTTVFRNGKAEFVSVGKLADDPEIEEMRNKIIRSYAGVIEGGKVFVAIDEHLYNYSALLIGRNYAMSDDDLTMLHEGTKWVQPICIHAIGGEKARDALTRSRIQEAIKLHARPEPPTSVFTEDENGPVVLNADLSLNPPMPPEFDLETD